MRSPRSIVGPQVTGLFCGAVATVSDLINLKAESTSALVITLTVIGLLIVFFVGFTRWGPVDIAHLREQRAFGQIVRTGARFYRRHWRFLLPVALIAIPIIGGTNLVSDQLGGGSSVGEASGLEGVDLAIADLIDTFGRPIASAIVAAVIVVFVREIAASRPAGFRTSFGGVRQRIWRVVFAQLLANLGVIALAFTVVGIPFAIWKLVGWAFVQQEVLFTDKSLRESFRGSSELVRGRWWHAMRAIVFFSLLSVVAGPMLTFALIFTPLPLVWIDLLGAFVYALLIPYVTVGRTLLYFDLQAREAAEPARPGRLRAGWSRLRNV